MFNRETYTWHPAANCLNSTDSIQKLSETGLFHAITQSVEIVLMYAMTGVIITTILAKEFPIF